MMTPQVLAWLMGDGRETSFAGSKAMSIASYDDGAGQDQDLAAGGASEQVRRRLEVTSRARTGSESGHKPYFNPPRADPVRTVVCVLSLEVSHELIVA